VRKSGDFIDALIRASGRISPYSTRALMIAATCLAVATMAHLVVGIAGSEQRFVTYYPAVMAAGLLAGVPAAIAVALGATLIVSSALAPTAMLLHTGGQIPDVFIFLISTCCIIIFAHCCRLVLRRLMQSELQHATLTNELIHRGRNTFAVVEVIVQKTLLHHPQAAKEILSRIRAVSRANDLISAAPHSGVHLRDLLIQEFDPFGVNRVDFLGPNLRIPPAVVRHLILIFHELVTNSAKYGSLSNSSGRVAIEWTIVEDVVTLNWKEEGGPLVAPPKREGFGTKLIAQCATSLSGKIYQRFSFDGFSCSLIFRMPTEGAPIPEISAITDGSVAQKTSAGTQTSQLTIGNAPGPTHG
jgi:two-component sensor histidine kinase